MIAGGKGANLGELSRIRGIRVPEGFCVTTEAYKKITENNQEFDGLLDELTRLRTEDRKSVDEISIRIRSAIERMPIPGDMIVEIEDRL